MGTEVIFNLIPIAVTVKILLIKMIFHMLSSAGGKACLGHQDSTGNTHAELFLEIKKSQPK